MSRSSYLVLATLSVALALVLCATPASAQKGQKPQQPTGPSSRLEDFTTTRNEAEKLKAKWASEKRKEEKVMETLNKVSDEMPAASQADVAEEVEDPAQKAAKLAAEQALRKKAEQEEEERKTRADEAERKAHEAAAKAAEEVAAQHRRKEAEEAAVLRKKQAEEAAIEAAKSPEQRAFETNELARIAKEHAEAHERALNEKRTAEEAFKAAERARRQEIDDMAGEGKFFIHSHHGHSMVLEGMHAAHFGGHKTFKLYHLGEEMGIATANLIYDIPAHVITEIHGIQLHDPSMMNRATHITPAGEHHETFRKKNAAREEAEAKLRAAQLAAKAPTPEAPREHPDGAQASERMQEQAPQVAAPQVAAPPPTPAAAAPRKPPPAAAMPQVAEEQEEELLM